MEKVCREVRASIFQMEKVRREVRASIFQMEKVCRESRASIFQMEKVCRDVRSTFRDFPKRCPSVPTTFWDFLNEMYLDKEKYFLLYFKQNEMKFLQERFIMRKLLLLWAAALCFLLFSCSKATISDVKNSDEAEGYISEISPTLIARTDSIFIRFTKDITGNVEKSLSTLGVKGKWEKVNEREVRFTPKDILKSSVQMQVCVNLAKLFSLDENLSYYHNFIADKADFSVELDGLEIADSSDEFSLSGTLVTDVPVDLATAEKMLSVSYSTKSKIEWDEEPKSAARYFKISGIEKGEHDRKLSISWNGKPIGADKKISKKYTIVNKYEFSVLDVNFQSENAILVSFSNKLSTTQDIENAFIAEGSAGGRANVNTTINKNLLTFYTDGNWNNLAVLTVLDGLESDNGQYLASNVEIIKSVNWEKPEIKFMTDGVIIPTTKDTHLTVGTKNLTGLLIQAYAIYDYNMSQFLQVNELDGTRELYRVGEPVWEKKVSFDWKDDDTNRFVPRALDVSELAKKYPSGMFQIRVTFRRDQIKYVCREGHRDFSSFKFPDDTIEDVKDDEESSWWDYYNDMDYDDRRTFWYYDDDPCHPAYYMPRYNSKCLIQRNILISDIGLQAKASKDNGVDMLHIAVTDMKTTKPIANASVKVLSFVGSTISEGKTDKDGLIALKSTGKVHLVTATNGSQTSYLKINAASLLSVDHFEISGEKSKDSLKGFIYGERGVWRPGDKMFLTFVLQDEKKTLPKDIPVLFELTDPLGRSAMQKTLTDGINGFYAIEAKTDKDAATGLWTASVSIGGNTWTKSLRVESVVPNRLSISLEADKKILDQGRNSFTLKGAWLHGAPTPNYQADVRVSFTPARTVFDGFGEYTFTNPQNSFTSTRETLWEGQLDSNSEAKFSERLEMVDDAPGMMKANMISRIFEPSGAFSTQSTSFDYSPYSRYVGLKLPKGDAARGMLLTDTDHTCDVALLNADGTKCSQGELRYTIYKLEWKWWWEKDALTDSSFVYSRSSSVIDSGEFTVQNGVGSFTLRVNYPDWGRYLVVVEDPNGHSAGKIVYIDWPGWAGRAQEGGSGSAFSVPLVCDKKSYTVGESAQISFASGEGGRALVTIEKNGGILKQEWLETKKETTVYKLPLTAEMSPNVYVHVSLLQQHQQTANSLPIRLFGVVPVMVDNPATKLEPLITTANSYEPNKEVSVSVSEKNGRAMTYTVAVVDEGLLGLTNYHAPNLRAEFYKKEASQIKNYDLYRYVMNAYSGNLESLLLIGGSEGGDDRDRDSNRFTPVVKFFGPFNLEAGEKKSLTYTMPQYIGAVRTIVIAGGNGAYGNAEKTTPVKSDLMIQPSIPRTLGTKEKIEIPLTLFNGTDKTQTYSVSMNATGVLSASEKKSVSVAPSKNETIKFSIETKKEGKAEINFVATAGSIKAESKTPIDVLSRGSTVTYKTPFELDNGKSTKVKVDSPMETVKLDLELSTFPAISLDERLASLISYPHGCIEQITSGGFPQIFIPTFLNLSPEQADAVKSNVKSVIERYQNYATPSGAMGYWPGNTSPHEWGSCYAAHFLAEARRNGYFVSDSLFEPLLAYISSSASKWTSHDEEYSVQAYRTFVLALAGRANISAMNRLDSALTEASKSDIRSEEPKMLLAASYALAGRQKKAKQLFEDAHVSFNGKFTRRTGGDFSSSYREETIWLFVDTLTGGSRNALKIAKEIGETLSSDRWLNTQEISWSLISLIPYYQGNSNATSSFEIIGKNSEKGSFTSPVFIKSLVATENAKTQEIEIKNTGKTTLFGTLSATGKAIAGAEKPKSDGLSLDVTYTKDGDEVSATDLKIGDTFTITVSIENDTVSEVQNVALTLPIPTCWEINNDRIGLDEDYNSNYDYQDIRDTAIYTYFSLSGRKEKTFQFSATVAYDGSYAVPAISAEAMYDNSYSALKPGVYVQN